MQTQIRLLVGLILHAVGLILGAVGVFELSPFEFGGSFSFVLAGVSGVAFGVHQLLPLLQN